MRPARYFSIIQLSNARGEEKAEEIRKSVIFQENQ